MNEEAVCASPRRMIMRFWFRRCWGTVASEITGIAYRSGGRVGDGYQTVFTCLVVFLYLFCGIKWSISSNKEKADLQTVILAGWSLAKTSVCLWPMTSEGRPLWGRTAYTAVHGARLSSMPSGDRSAKPATSGVPGHSNLLRAHISVSSARKCSRAEMLATTSGVSKAASSASSCWCAIPGYRTSRCDYTRDQSPETGSLSGHLVMWEPLPSLSHWVLPCRLWFYQSSLPRRWHRSEYSRFKRRLWLRQSWCPWPRTYEGRPHWGRALYTVAYDARLFSVPSGHHLPTLSRSVFQDAAISSEHTSQFLPPGNVAELGCSPLLRESDYTWGQFRETGSLSMGFVRFALGEKHTNIGSSPWNGHCKL